jgi:CubicO group peptidase (beta-lactamase class C family)
VVILQDGQLVAEWYFGKERRPIEIMSVLKSIVSLGVGKLITDGLIDSLDQPVHTFYPEWRQGLKQEITIRHLLNHTSGIQNVPNAGAEIYPSPNAVKLALAAELEADPGSVFRYNNKAVNLLAGIIEQASGSRMDLYFRDEFFRAMGIEEYQWHFDRSGTPHAMAGLRLHARDLTKFGELVLQGGMWNGERLVSEGYIAGMLAEGQPHDPRFGLLWWRLPDGAGRENGAIVAYYGDGYLGQTLMVIPEHDVVAVRQVAGSEDYDPEADGFGDFKERVLQLIRK